MCSTSKPLAEITNEAIRILLREIGVVNTVRFLNQYTAGYGNYSEERDQLFGHLILDAIVQEIEQNREIFLIRLVTLVTLVSGFLNLISLIRPLSFAPAFIDLPLVAASRLLTLLVGLALVVSAVNVYRRRRLAYYAVLGLALIAALAQVSARPDPVGLAGPLLLLLLLARTRHLFTARPSTFPTTREP